MNFLQVLRSARYFRRVGVSVRDAAQLGLCASNRCFARELRLQTARLEVQNVCEDEGDYYAHLVLCLDGSGDEICMGSARIGEHWYFL